VSPDDLQVVVLNLEYLAKTRPRAAQLVADLINKFLLGSLSAKLQRLAQIDPDGAATVEGIMDEILRRADPESRTASPRARDY
jgi:hypothetical protein